jgi:hypothetical protein
MNFTLKWIYYWGMFFQSIIGILTLGFYSPKWVIDIAKIKARRVYNGR